MNDSHLFKLARKCSKNATYTGCGKVSIGCVVVYKGTILAKSANSDTTHPIQNKYNKWRYQNSNGKYLAPKLHAEIAAINKIKYLDIDFSKVHVYVYREYKDGTPALAKPCPSCEAALREMGIVHVHYTGKNSYIHEKFI